MKATQTIFVERMDMPVGVMLVVTDAADALRAVNWHDCEDLMHTLLRHSQHATFAMEIHPSWSSAARPLGAYFTGDVKAIEGAFRGHRAHRIPEARMGCPAGYSRRGNDQRRRTDGRPCERGQPHRHCGTPPSCRWANRSLGGGDRGVLPRRKLTRDQSEAQDRQAAGCRMRV